MILFACFCVIRLRSALTNLFTFSDFSFLRTTISYKYVLLPIYTQLDNANMIFFNNNIFYQDHLVNRYNLHCHFEHVCDFIILFCVFRHYRYYFQIPPAELHVTPEVYAYPRLETTRLDSFLTAYIELDYLCTCVCERYQPYLKYCL